MIRKHLLLSLFFLAPLLDACGPWLPEPYLLRNDSLFYAPPEVGFAAELKHLLPDSVPHSAVLNEESGGVSSAVQELKEALEPGENALVEHEDILAAFQAFRQQLNAVKPYLDAQPYMHYRPPVDEANRDAKLEELKHLKVPSGLPEEFRLYLGGALAYYQGDIGRARAQWTEVVNLPDKQRHYRSVMAAYMLAKTDPHLDPKVYSKVRDLAASGYADQLGLAAASYGRQAQLHLRLDEYQEAIDLYLKQWASGYGNAVQSLEITAGQAWADWNHKIIDELVENKSSRSVLTAYLLTQHENDQISQYRQRLLRALPEVDSLEVAEAGRFALIEYQQNNLSAARLWLSYAGADDALALWVRSKLLLRAGKIDEGRILMLALTKSFDGKLPEWRRLDTKRAWGELGLLFMREERYGEAADAFWNARSWTDCAYVLERLLATEELLAWLEKHPPGTEITDNNYEEAPRALAARRFMREARFEEALGLFEDESRAAAERYMRSMKAAYDLNNDAAVRARHFWAAAKVMRSAGMELFGAELAPDHAWVGGQFDWIDLEAARNEARWTVDYEINAVSHSEVDLAEHTRIQPSKRFHYRYRAVQLAELAAGLLPNNDEDAARIYLVSASWIQKRDPVAADRLYKQLAVRCADTELGRAALQVNWFPKVELKDYEPFPTNE